MNTAIKYINEVLGSNLVYKEASLDTKNKLPFFIAKGYDFLEINLFNQRIILMIVKNDFTIEILRTHLFKVRTILNIITVAVLPPIDAYKRLRLIEKHIPFIVPGKQMYMPDLLISLKEYGLTNIENQQTLNMQPSAQCILLYHIQVETLEGLNFGMIANKLHYNPMTITRAAFYFQNSDLCKIEGTKEKYLKFNKSKKELWALAEPKMTNPVNKTQFYTGFIHNKSLKKANINALAHYTDINDEQVEYLAMRPGYGKFIGGINLKPIDKMEGNICIEEWKYDPELLTKTEFIDPLSLYLYFRENKNERIELSIEKLINQIEW
ncbi:MAG TPA: hypothetical protein VJ954_03415 [Ignavibacteriaceae bacterium]|nr:hypothetical protein [Ignavibacteriaceae bacterium]